MTKPRKEVALGVGAAALSVAFALAFTIAAPRTFPLDDAYIHLAYGKSLAFSGTLGLNPGEPSLGTSSPLWALVLVPLFWMVRDPYWSIHAIGLASLGGVVLLGTRFLDDALATLRLTPVERRVLTAVGGLLLGTNGSLIWMSLSGMETTLVLLLCMATVATYAKYGPSWRTGILLGLCILGRSTSLALVVSLGVAELVSARRVRGMIHMVGAAVVMYAPYAAYSYRVAHSVFPNTAKGKLLTYVSGGFNPEEFLHFLGRVIAFHKYLPALFLVAAAIVYAGARFHYRHRRSPIAHALSIPALAPIAVLGIWSVVHVGQYMLAFRTIGQQGRYLSEWLVAVTVVGGFAVGAVVASLRAAAAAYGAAFALVAAHLATVPYWRGVYRHNVEHVWTAYVEMARYIRENLPKHARIASFDIGTIRYLGDRYTLDLGGLVDTSTHACLGEHACGEYTRLHEATHVMYPKDPESDYLTGVQRAEFAKRILLREELLKQIAATDYAAPTLTHSFRLELFRIEGWYDRKKDGDALRAFRRSDIALTPFDVNPDGDFAIVGAHIDNSTIRYIREYPYTFTLWVAYKPTKPLTSPKWLNVVLYDDESREVLLVMNELVTDGAVDMKKWPVGEVLEEHRVVPVPYDRVHGKAHVLATATARRDIDFRYPELYEWADLGMLDVQRSETTALSPR